jgi:hypothetical protein
MHMQFKSTLQTLHAQLPATLTSKISTELQQHKALLALQRQQELERSQREREQEEERLRLEQRQLTNRTNATGNSTHRTDDGALFFIFFKYMYAAWSDSIAFQFK